MWDLQGAATAIILCIGATIIILLTAVAALFALAVGFVIVLYALFALACLAVVGPIFVGALLFDSTRSYFFSWLGSVLNFLMLSLFALLLVLVVANRSEEHTSELQSLMRTSYAVFCLKKKNKSKKTMIQDDERKYNQCNNVVQQEETRSNYIHNEAC